MTDWSLMNIAQIYDYRFPITDWPIMQFQMRMFEIAQSFGFRVESWQEDGLGEAHGMFLRLPSERVILFREMQHLIKHDCVKGPTVWIDVGVVAEIGVEPLVAEVLTAINLPPEAVDWVNAPEGNEAAVDFVKRVSLLHGQKE